MLTSIRDREQEAAGNLENTDYTSVSFKKGSRPFEIYFKGGKSVRTDVLFNHAHVISFIYIQEWIAAKAFLAKRITDFSSGHLTATVCSEACWDFTPFRVADKVLLSDVLLFWYALIDDNFPSIAVGVFLSGDSNLA